MTTRMPVGRRAHTVLDSPVGPLTLVAVDGVLAGLHMTQQRHGPDPRDLGEPDPAPFGEAARQLDGYFAGTRTEFDLDLALAGTPFQQRVWKELQAVGYGETISYGQLADRVGRPSASRAVGLANGRNPVAIIIPCHRVVGADGGLTGYGGGIDSKRYLLEHELQVRSRMPG